MISRCRYLIWLTWRRVVHRPVLSILLLAIFIFISDTIVVMVFEKAGFGGAVREVFPAFLGELGVIESPFLAVQISIVVAMITSITF